MENWGLKKIFSNSRLSSFFIGKNQKILLFLAGNAFILILILILASVIFGEFLFYKHVFLPNKEEQKSGNISAVFQENLYESVLEEIEEIKNIFENPLEGNYIDPFF
jgi:hypothetical protein